MEEIRIAAEDRQKIRELERRMSTLDTHTDGLTREVASLRVDLVQLSTRFDDVVEVGRFIGDRLTALTLTIGGGLIVTVLGGVGLFLLTKGGH